MLYSASCDALKLYIDDKENSYAEIAGQISIISADVVEWIGEKE